MEHEDNAQLENYLQNSQNRIENIQLASSVGVIGASEGVGDVAGEIVDAGNVGQKYGGDHDDDEEWKYINEGQQSEKQQHQHQLFGVNVGNDVDVNVFGVVSKAEENGISGPGLVGHSNGGSNGGGGDYEEEFLLAAHAAIHGNGDAHRAVDNIAFGATGDAVILNEEEEIEVIKNDGDFSTISNTDTTTASTGEVGAAVDVAGDAPEADILQVDVKIEQKKISEQQQQQLSHDDEEEPSSVATTYGTSSLSENPTPLEQEAEQNEPLGNQPQLLPLQEQNPLLQQDIQHDIGLHFESFDNKENADPADIENIPININADLHSELNPNALEFVPSFGSQPTSPTEEQPAFGTPRPAAVPRHMFSNEDDLVAESPRKGLGADMDAISLPAENEFEHEADQRPHEQDDDLFGIDNALPQHSPLHLEATQLQENLENGKTGNEDCLDFQRQSPSSFVDHGPETSVDLDADPLVIGNTSNEDVMNKSIYIEQSANMDQSAPIEDILNSVQLLPVESDSHNNSFNDQPQETAEHVELLGNFETAAEGVKELLNVEEKELVSHSPSTEELQMNLQNEMNSSIKDIPQLPIDPLDSATNMQESFYLEHTSSDLGNLTDQSLLLETSIPQEIKSGLLDDEPQQQTIEDPQIFNVPPHQLELTPEIAAVVDITPSPLTSSFTTEEKHLVEETKEQLHHLEDREEEQKHHLKEEEQQREQQRENEIAQQMDALLSGDVIVGTPPQAEQEAESLAATNDNFNVANPFAVEKQPQEQSKYEFAHASAAEQAFEGQILLEAEEEKRNEIEKEHQQQQLYNETLWSEQPQSQQELEQEQESSPLVENEEQPKPAEETTKLTEFDVEHEIITESNLIASPEQQFNDNDVVKAVEYENQPAEPLVTEEMLSPVETAPAVPELSISEATPEKPADEDSVPTAVAAATAAAAVVAATAATVGLAKSIGNEEPGKKVAAKPKAATAGPVTKKPASVELTAKKSTTSTKSAKPAGAVGAAARPRTAPTSAAAKSTTTATTSTARKPLMASSTTTTKAAPRTTTATRPATAPAGAKPGGAVTARTNTAASTTTSISRLATARKPTTTANGTSGAATTAASKARTAPTKPTTLTTNGTGIGSSSTAPAKPKLSPRSTLTSQLRKTAPAATASTAGAKSPTKPLANGVAKTTTTTVASRTKLAGSVGTASTTKTTTTTTVTTKTFTARPAPKTTHSSTLTATRRPLSASTTTTTARRSSPLKPANISGSKSPTTAKSTTPLKAKAKEPVAKSSPSSASIRGKKPGSAAPPKVAASADANGVATKDEQIEPLAVNGNGAALNETIELEPLANDLPALDAPKQPDQVALLEF